MKLTIAQSALSSALKRASSIASGRVTLPILSTVLLEARGEKLFVTSNNLDMSIQATADAVVDKPGTVCVPVKQLAKAAEFGESIEISADEKGCRITSGAFKCLLRSMPATKFPIPIPVTGKPVELTQEVLKRALGRVDYAASTEAERYVYNGVFFCTEGLVTTDGRRLSMAEAEMKIPEFILPNAAVAELKSNLTAGPLSLTTNENTAQFTAPEFTLIAKLVDGKLPNWKQVIPADADSMTVNREEFVTAMSRAALACSDSHYSVRITVEKNRIVFRALSPEVGESGDEIVMKTGIEPVVCAINPDYVLECLKALDEETVRIQITSGMDPIKITASHFTAVVMVMRLS